MTRENYEPGTNRQTLGIGKTSLIALWGGGPKGERLTVRLNNAQICEVIEKSASGGNRIFELVGRAPGDAMVEAKADDGSVWAFMQVGVTGNKDIAKMSGNEKLAEVIRRSEPYMPAEVWNQVKALLEPSALAVMGGVTAAWATSHFFGVGEIADAVLVVVGGIVLGLSALDAGRELYQFALGTTNARTEGDLDAAAKHFARAVVLLGVTVVTALFFKNRPKNTFKEPFFGGPAKIPVPPPRGPGPLYTPTTTVGLLKSKPGFILRGTTDAFGNITVELRQPAADIVKTLLHERVHQFLTPKLYFMRNVRVKVAIEGYNRSYILRYLEEALAQTYALVRTEGGGAILEGIKFPVANGYVSVVAMGQEAKGVLLGSVTVGGQAYRVYAEIH